ncbi:hypothetical protein V6N13_123467 [Hibiscus sabdariffa]|uniref:Rx N-terminal domain-containing protein n=1 Tax=Hibiscus sabdariffa TaxID=183260 RepID=A0ABR2QTJ4_9ROSI
MAEALVSFILVQLRTVTFEIAGQELKLVTDVEKEVKNIRRNLDADEKQIVETTTLLCRNLCRVFKWEMEL